MATKSDIHNFALKWRSRFMDPKADSIEFLNHFMADDCKSLGFEMDCGHAFGEKYGIAASESEALEKIIDDVDDVMLLGSAIYSQWRYFNHWAEPGEDILAAENRSWFITALSRLAELTVDTEYRPPLITGKIRKIKICSNSICFGPEPSPEDEVEQHLTITRDGRVFFSSYIYGDGIGRHRKNVTKNFKTDSSRVQHIFTYFERYFSEDYNNMFVTDVGEWTMELTNLGGEVFKFHGPLCGDMTEDGIDLSDLVRDELDMQNLYVFDGNNKPDIIQRIEIDYHRVSTFIPREPISEEVKFITQDYTESLIVDRKSETVEYFQHMGSECSAERKYHVTGGISDFLDNFDAKVLFCNIEGNSPDVVRDPVNQREYTFTIDYEKQSKKVITGTFDKNGLPEDFPEFMEELWKFMSFYGYCELFDSSLYRKALRKKGEYIFCSVNFKEGGKTYYYLTDDDSLKVGDRVKVPSGKYNHSAVARIEKIEYFKPEDAPFPVNKVKHIIGRFDGPDDMNR